MFSTSIPKKYQERVESIEETDNDEAPVLIMFKKPWCYDEFHSFNVESKKEFLEVIKDARKLSIDEYEKTFGE